MNPFGYPEPVWRLFRETPNAGSWPEGEPGVVTARAGTRAGSAVLQLQCRLRDGRVTQARFKALGCPTTIAVGAWLARALEGRALDSLSEFGARKLRQDLEIPEDRAHCALLGEDAVKALAASAAGT